MNTPEEKLASIRRSSYDTESRIVLSEWRDQLVQLRAEEDFVSHPITQEMARIAREQIEAIRTTLSDNENISEIDRKTLFSMKRVHEIYLSLFTKDPESAIELLEKSIDEELAEG